MTRAKFYENPRVRVWASNKRGTFGPGSHPDERYPINRSWTVWQDGEPTEFRVVESTIGLTVINADNHMVSCWNIGVGPGDLARLTMKKRER